MLRRLRRRLILLVLLMLLLISAGIVLAINLMNERQISSDAYAALDLLAQNDGRRPFMQRDSVERPERPEGTRPPLPDGEDEDGWLSGRSRDRFAGRQTVNAELQASLGNYVVVSLSGDDTVQAFMTDRSDLYTTDELAALVSQMLGQQKDLGRIGRQYYRLNSHSDGSRSLIILDNRLAGENARQVLEVTIIVAACAWALLSASAVWLICRMLRPVEEAFVKQRQFVSDASHELKTPLAVISANAQALVRERGHDEQTDYILSEVGRADSLVRSLLSLARLDQAAPKAEFRPFDLSQAVLSVALPFESTVFEAGRSLETEIPEGITLNGHEEMIKQLAVILLSNALKYSDEHGTIRLRLESRGGKRVITVSNTGEGIAPENRGRVFDRFWREDASHSSAVPGHGLGLAIAKSIVEMHRGQITAGGEWHKNAVFTVTL